MATDMLPGDRMRAVLSLPLTAAEINMMVLLAYHDGPGNCKISIERMCGVLGIHRQTAYERLKSIKKKGYLSWQKWQSTNLYTLVYEPLTVRENHTVTEEELTVRESPPLTVRKSLTQREEGKKGRREEGKTPVIRKKMYQLPRLRITGYW